MFSSTKGSPLFGLRTAVSKIALTLRARLEGLGFNAACRTYDISATALRLWEARFAGLKRPLFLYALGHQFLQQVIEGDEMYTKIAKNLPPDESEGWTLKLMDRASRFMWVQECGRRDRKLFTKAISALKRIIEQTRDLTLITDGERRYGNILFELCNEAVRTGKRGRPKKRFAAALEFASRTRAAARPSQGASVRNMKRRRLSIRRPARTSKTATSMPTMSKPTTLRRAEARRHLGGKPTPTPRRSKVSSES